MNNEDVLSAFHDWLLQNRRMFPVGEQNADKIIEASLSAVRGFGKFIDPTPLWEASYAEERLFQGDRRVIKIFLQFKNTMKQAAKIKLHSRGRLAG